MFKAYTTLNSQPPIKQPDHGKHLFCQYLYMANTVCRKRVSNPQPPAQEAQTTKKVNYTSKKQVHNILSIKIFIKSNKIKINYMLQH